MSHNCLWIDCLHHIHTFTPATNEWTSERTKNKQTNQKKNGENGTKWTIFFPNEIIMTRRDSGIHPSKITHFISLTWFHCVQAQFYLQIFFDGFRCWWWRLIWTFLCRFAANEEKKYGRSTKAEPQNEWSAVYHISNWPLCWINSIERLFSYEELSVDWPSVFISQHHCCLVTMLCIFAFIFVCKHTHTDKQSESRWQNRVAAAAKKSR